MATLDLPAYPSAPRPCGALGVTSPQASCGSFPSGGGRVPAAVIAMAAHLASAVATQEATDEDSNCVHDVQRAEITVAIRKPADAGNGYRAPLPPVTPGADGVLPAAQPGRIQIFPAGHFAARDGRPGSLKGVSADSFRLGPEDMVALIGRWRGRSTPLVVDYEHQTQHSAENGQPAPATSWITQLEATPQGLFATVEWTARAREHIRAGEYRYISPTFSFDRKTGAVLELHSAPLTNTPALDGMDAASAKTFTNEDATMDKLLAALCVLLGLPDLNSPEQAAEALQKHLPQANFVALLKSKDDALTAAQAQIAEAKAAPPDPALYVTLSTFQAVQAEAASLRATVSRLETEKAAAGLEEEIACALKDGRLAAAAEPWARDLALSDPEALRAFLKAAPPVAALSGTQSGNRAPETPAASLEAEEAFVCAQLGMSHEEYIKAKEEK